MKLSHCIVALSVWLVSVCAPAGAWAARFVDIEAGARHTCGLTDTGRVYCWGREVMSNGRYPLVASETYREFDAARIARGTHQGFAMDANGKAICWGENDADQCAIVPEKMLAISGADRHACGVNLREAIYCWGSDDHMNLSSFNGGTYAAVASGYFHTCGLGVDGKVTCAGCERGSAERDIDAGQCDVPEHTAIVAVTAGRLHTCMLDENGQVVCFGASRFGQTAVPESVTFSQVAAGSMHTCGIEKGSGRLYCWGRDKEGQSQAPDGVFTDVTAGFKMSCGLRESGEVVCWGEDSEGFLSAPGLSTIR